MSRPAGRQSTKKGTTPAAWTSVKSDLVWEAGTALPPEKRLPQDEGPEVLPGTRAAPEKAGGQGEEENLRSLWREFTETTAFHGFNKLSRGHHATFRWGFWFLAILAMAVFLVYNVFSEISRYYQYPTITSVEVEMPEELEFPAVTLCNLSPFNATLMAQDPSGPALEQFMLSLSALPFLAGDIDWSSPEFDNPTFNTPQIVQDMIASSMQQSVTFSQCVFEGEFVPCTDFLKPTVTDDGICFTFNGDRENAVTTRLTGSNNHLKIYALASQDHYAYTGETAAGFKVFLHKPGEAPLLTTQQVFAGAGLSTQIALEQTKFKYLPTPYTAFGTRKCLDTKGGNFVNPLRHFRNYTYSLCMLECRAQYIYERCNCTTLSDPLFGPSCTLKQVALCYIRTRAEFELNVEAKSACGCLKECQFEQYSTQVSTASYPSNKWSQLFVSMGWLPNTEWARDNAVELRVYFNSLMVTTVTQKAEVTYETIMGNLGGQMGLCLGASILTISELAEFLFFLGSAIWSRIRDPHRVQRLSK